MIEENLNQLVQIEEQIMPQLVKNQSFLMEE